MRAARYTLALLSWMAAGFVALRFAMTHKVGPVVFVLSPTHGIHEGDVIVFAAACCCAALFSLVVLRNPSR